MTLIRAKGLGQRSLSSKVKSGNRRKDGDDCANAVGKNYPIHTDRRHV